MKEYFSALYRDWVSLLSGIASVVLVVMGYVKWTSGIPVGVFGTAALICFIIANYRVWQREHSIVKSLEGPTVLVEFAWQFQRVPLGEPLHLINSSTADALNITIDTIPFQNRAGVFNDPIPRLGAKARVQIVPDRIDGGELDRNRVANWMWIADLFRPNDANLHSAGSRSEIPFAVHYKNVYGRRFETTHSLIFDSAQKSAMVSFRTYKPLD